MGTWKQQQRREANGQTLFLVLKILAFVGFIALVFALGANPFTGEIPTD